MSSAVEIISDKFDLNAVRLNYRLWKNTDISDDNNSVPWLVMFNGHSRPLTDFNILAKKICAAGYNVCAMDIRGSGSTEYSGDFDLSDVTGDIFALLKHCDIRSYHLLGISMGGVLAQYIASVQDTVDSVILISTTARKEFLKSTSEPWPNESEGVLARLRKFVSKDFYSESELLMKSMAKQMAQKLESTEYQAGLAGQRNLIDEGLANLGSIRCPLFIIHGDEDQIIDKQAAFDLQQRYENAEMKLLSGKGHLLLAEAGPTLAKLIIGHLGLVG